MTNHLSTYAYFTCTTKLSQAATQHMLANWRSMNQTDRIVLELILQHSVDHCVAHLPHRTLEKETGKSNATVRRAVRKLVKLEIIERRHYINPVIKGLGPNIYAIRPYNAPASLEENATSYDSIGHPIFNDTPTLSSDFLE